MVSATSTAADARKMLKWKRISAGVRLDVGRPFLELLGDVRATNEAERFPGGALSSVLTVVEDAQRLDLIPIWHLTMGG